MEGWGYFGEWEVVFEGVLAADVVGKAWSRHFKPTPMFCSIAARYCIIFISRNFKLIENVT